MSEQEIKKKQLESTELDPFLEAYERTTGSELSVLEGREDPDFICTRPNGELVGLELTKVMRRHDVPRQDRILDRNTEMAPLDTIIEISRLIEDKESKRKMRYSVRVSQTMLVLQLVDGSLDGLVHLLDGLIGGFHDQGFVEIWVADYSGLEAYGDIELFGLYPANVWGYKERLWPDRKPFG